MNVSRQLLDYCKQIGATVDEGACTEDHIVLHNVPVNARALTKPQTNVCLARDPVSGKFEAWVDRNLQPRDPRCAAASVLSGSCNENWQRVSHRRKFSSPEAAFRETHELLASGTVPERARPSKPNRISLPPDSLLAKCARFVPTMPPAQVLCREPFIHDAARLWRNGGGMVTLCGGSGSGLTSTAVAVMTHLHQRDGAEESDKRAAQPEFSNCLLVDCGQGVTTMTFPANTDERFRQLLDECLEIPGATFVFDNLQWPLQHGKLVHIALVAALDRGLRCLGTFQTDGLEGLAVIPALARRICWLSMPALETQEIDAILDSHMATLQSDRDVRFEPAAVSAVRSMSPGLPGSQPGRVLRLLHTAAALVEDGGAVSPDEVHAARHACSTSGDSSRSSDV